MNALYVVAVFSAALSTVEVKADSCPGYDDISSSPCYATAAAADPCYGQLASPYYYGAPGAPLLAPPPPASPCASAPPSYLQIPYSTMPPCQDLGRWAPFPSPCPAPCAPPPCPCSAPVACSPSQSPCPSPCVPCSCSCSSPCGPTAPSSRPPPPPPTNVYRFVSPPPAPSAVCHPSKPCKSPRPPQKLVPLVLKPFPRKAQSPCATSPPARPYRFGYELNLSKLSDDPSACSLSKNRPSPACGCRVCRETYARTGRV